VTQVLERCTGGRIRRCRDPMVVSAHGTLDDTLPVSKTVGEDAEDLHARFASEPAEAWVWAVYLPVTSPTP